MPEISVIVPVYKVEPYLDRCVRSILNQTFTDFELILVDDGSPDQCPQMCDEWAKKDERIRVIHKENGGASAARNAGLDAACGRYIEFIDSDDWVDCEIMEYLYTLLKNHPQAQIAQCEWMTVKSESEMAKTGEKDEKIEIWDKKKMLDYFYRVNGERSNNAIWNKLIQAELLRNFRFSGAICEDVEANLYFFSKTDFMVVSNRQCYYYFVNNEGLTRSYFKMKDLDYLTAMDRIVERTKKEYPEYLQYAEFYRKRVNFTLLSKMTLRGYDRKNVKMKEIKKRLKKEVRKDFWTLMRGKLPVSRKVLLVLLVV